MSQKSNSPFPALSDIFSNQSCYGRNELLEQLQQYLTDIQQGHPQLVLIAGYAGIGKTTLLHAFQNRLTPQQTFFLQGKFDPLQRDYPYYPFIHALRQLLQMLLFKSQDTLPYWQQQLSQSLGDNIALILPLLPELKQLLPHAKKILPVVPIAEAQQRFFDTLRVLIQVFAQPQHPLILFIDDLHWADQPSLTLLEQLCTDTTLQHLLIITAYRHNEVHTDHPLLESLTRIQQRNKQVHTHFLNPLQAIHYQQILQHHLGHIDNLSGLTQLCYKKTQGNPFFLKHYLSTLQQQQYLYFHSDNYLWQWDAEKIKQQLLPDNITTLMQYKLQLLPPQTRKLLSFAACIGNTFDLSILINLFNADADAVQAALIPAIEENFCLAQQLFDHTLTTQRYQFSHDHIQQITYQWLSHQDKITLHLRIGRYLQQSQYIQDDEQQHIFTLVHHFNIAAAQITDPEERLLLARLNYRAGQRAKSSAAYPVSLRYFLQSVAFYPSNIWQDDYQFALPLYQQIAETAYICADYPQMQQSIRAIFHHAKHLLDSIFAYEIRIQAAIAQGKPKDAIMTALHTLSLLGIIFPDIHHINIINTLKVLAQTQYLLYQTGIQHISSLPSMQAEEKLAAMRIMCSVSSASYVVYPRLTPLLWSKMVQLSLQYGNAPASAFGYSAYAIILGGTFKRYHSAYQLAMIADKLLSQDSNLYHARTLFAINAFNRHWQEPISNALPHLLQAYHSGTQTGDIEYACYALYLYHSYPFWMGKPLTQIQTALQQAQKIVHKYQQKTVMQWIYQYQQCIANLRVPNQTNPQQLQGQYYQKTLSWHHQHTDQSGLCHRFLLQMLLCYLHNDINNAYQYSKQTKKYLNAITAQYSANSFYFYQSLILFAGIRSIPQDGKKYLQFHFNYQQLKRLNTACSENFQHRLACCQALNALLNKRFFTAQKYFTHAITLAKQQGHLLDQAICNELQAQLYQKTQQFQTALWYLQNAYLSYQKWGALSKLALLKQQYPQLLTLLSAQHPPPETFTLTTIFNFLSHLKTLPSDQIPSQLLSSLAQHIPAQHIVWITLETHQPIIQAHYTEENSIHIEIPLISTIIQHVISSKTPLLVNELLADQRFQSITEQYPAKTLLCYPILFAQQIRGMLYLDNCLHSHIFTAQHHQILETLTQHTLWLHLPHYQSIEKHLAQRTDALSNAYRQIKQYQVQLQQAAKINILDTFFHSLDQTSIQHSLLQEETTSFLFIEHLQHVYQLIQPLLKNSHSIASIDCPASLLLDSFSGALFLVELGLINHLFAIQSNATAIQKAILHFQVRILEDNKQIEYIIQLKNTVSPSIMLPTDPILLNPHYPPDNFMLTMVTSLVENTLQGKIQFPKQNNNKFVMILPQQVII